MLNSLLFIINKRYYAMKIYITEQQNKLLFEAAMPGFRLDYLRNCGSFSKRLAYCRQMLGNYIGNGSSRTVFQIDDYACLKLAKNVRGIQQNLREIQLGTEPYLSLFPKVLNGTDEENGLWIISEFVLPIRKKGEEFEDIYNVPFSDIQRFISFVTMCGRRGYNKYAENWVHQMYEMYEENGEVCQLFDDLRDLYYSYNHSIRDLQDYHNWGLTLRDGQPTLVILDAGLSDEIDKQFYRRYG